MGSWERQKESEPCYPSQTFISWAISAVRFTCWFIPDRAASMVETVKSLTASLTSFSVATWDLLSWFMKGRYVKCRVTKRKTEHTHRVCLCVLVIGSHYSWMWSEQFIINWKLCKLSNQFKFYTKHNISKSILNNDIDHFIISGLKIVLTVSFLQVPRLTLLWLPAVLQ